MSFGFGSQRLQGITGPLDGEVFVEDIDKEFEKFFGVLLSVGAPFFVQTGTEFLGDYVRILSMSLWCSDEAFETYSKIGRPDGVDVRGLPHVSKKSAIKLC